MLKAEYEKLLGNDAEYKSKDLDKDIDRKNIFLQRLNELDTNNISIKHNKWAKDFKINGDNAGMILADEFMSNSSELQNAYNKFSNMFQKEIYEQYHEYFDLGRKWKTTKGMFSLFWCLDEHQCLTTDELWPKGFGNY